MRYENGVVILGAGHGGVQVAASLREDGYDGPVTLVGEESELPYHRPPLSKTFIKNDDAQPQILRAESFYGSNRIGLRLGRRAEKIDRTGKRLEMAGGDTLAFDRLVLATGSRPRALTISGQLDGVLSLRSAADARAIRERSRRVQDVAVIGGGFIGLEIAATLAAAGQAVTVVETQAQLLSRGVPPLIAGHVAGRLGAAGVRILAGTAVDSMAGDPAAVSAVVTSSGERIPAGMVVVGIGARPNVELAAAAGLDVDGGICVDPQMRSSTPEILAVGDAVSFRHRATGSQIRLESVQNATDQARLAARTIVGHAEAYAAVPWFWSDIGDIKLQMVGLSTGADSSLVSGEPSENRFSVFHYRSGRLLAIDTVNRPADHMLGRRMLGAGYSPPPDLIPEGIDALKAAFADWQRLAIASTRP